MRTSLACFGCSFLLSLTCGARDLAGYDTLGPLEQRPIDPNDSVLTRVREFVWQHWTERRRGYAVATRYSREGEPSVFHFYIEPDAGGTWQVVIDGEHERTNRARGKDLKRSRETSHCVARRVGRLRNYQGAYYFQFRDGDGKVVSIW
jgi:hypothetical protein